MSATRTGAELLVACLERYGVERVAGNPGTTELPLLQALGESDVAYDLAHHEDVAVGMAAGYATVCRDHLHERRQAAPRSDAAGRRDDERALDAPSADAAEDWPVLPLGVANLHLLAGVAHGLGNLYNAWTAGVPLLVTAGTHDSSFRDEEPILSGDLQRHVEPYTKDATEVGAVDALPSAVRRAVRTALTPPTGPVFLAIPRDVAQARTDAEPEPLGAIPGAGRGDPAELERAAELLAAADEVVLVAGDGIARAGPGAIEAAVDLAEATGARVHGEALSAAVSFPRNHELWASVLPPAEASLRRHLDADAVVLAGCSTNTTLVAHEDPLVPADADVVHLGADPDQFGRRVRADAAVAGDPGATLDELASGVEARLRADRRRERRAAAADRARTVREATRERHAPSDTAFESGAGAERPGAGDRAPSGADRASSDTARPSSGTARPSYSDSRPTSSTDRPTAGDLAIALNRAVPEALVVDEGVSAKYALLAHRDLEPGEFHSTKGGCLGYGLSAAVGAALAERERAGASGGESRPVVGLVGDGALCYYPQALRAAVRAGVDLTVVVANNGGYASVAANAETVLEDAPEPAELPGLSFEEPVDAAALARGHGASGVRVADPAELPDTLETAADEAGVTVVDVLLAE